MAILWQDFERYALTLLEEGACVCPACLGKRLLFTTDDRCLYYSMECASCHMGVRDVLFMNIHQGWNMRRSKDPALKRRTWDIECTFWNREEKKTEHVEPCGACPYASGRMPCPEDPCPGCQDDGYGTFRTWMGQAGAG